MCVLPRVTQISIKDGFWCDSFITNFSLATVTSVNFSQVTKEHTRICIEC
jgi:hypothetical protein